MTNGFKVIAALAIALFISFIFISLVMTVLKIAIATLFGSVKLIILLLIFTLPIYIIVKKKMFK